MEGRGDDETKTQTKRNAMNTADVVVKLSDETRNYHEICAVTTDEIEGRSLDGWVLIAITRKQSVAEPAEILGTPDRLVIEVPIFVMGRTQDEAERAAAAAVDTAVLAAAEHDLRQMEEERDQAREELEESRRHHAARIDELIEQANRFGLAQEANRRMETDLAKAREHIGAKAWGEIFADADENAAARARYKQLLKETPPSVLWIPAWRDKLGDETRKVLIEGIRASERNGNLEPKPPLTDINGAFANLAALRDGGMVGRELVSMLHSFNPHIRQVAVTPISSRGYMADDIKITVTERNTDAEDRVKAEIERLRPVEAVAEVSWVLWQCRAPSGGDGEKRP